MRMSSAAVIEGATALSVTVRTSVAVTGSEMVKNWFAAAESVGTTIVIVCGAVDETTSSLPTSSSRLSGPEMAEKLVNASPETVT